MKCAEKEDLQQKCSAAWTVYEEAMKRLGFDPTTKVFTLQLMYRGGPTPPLIDRETGALNATYREVFFVGQNYRKASSALSKHLSTHRC